MDGTRVTLAALWVSAMLTFLLGDVLRIFAGDFTPGEIDGEPVGQRQWLLAAVIMLVPIAMVILSLVLPYPLARWVSIVVALLFIAFNMLGLPYPGMYDNFLIVASFVICGLVVWYAWTW